MTVLSPGARARTLVCDLDGVVYRGDVALPGAGDALARIEAAGWDIFFATNNSARTPDAVVAKLGTVAGYETEADRIVTSALVAAELVTEGPVFVAGEEGIRVAVVEAGFDTTDDPSAAATVVAGLDRSLSYEGVARAADAVRTGARLIVTNRDPTFPVHGGLMPGAGACVAAIETAAGVRGTTAGKPTEAMRRFIEARAGDGPIWMVGDRPDTDIALASGHRWSSILVMTGVTTTTEGLDPVPDAVAEDLASAVEVLVDGSLSRPITSDLSP